MEVVDDYNETKVSIHGKVMSLTMAVTAYQNPHKIKAGKSPSMEERGTPEISLIDEEVLATAGCWQR